MVDRVKIFLASGLITVQNLLVITRIMQIRAVPNGDFYCLAEYRYSAFIGGQLTNRMMTVETAAADCGSVYSTVLSLGDEKQ